MTKQRPSVKAQRPWFVYLLQCASGKMYTGITPDLQKRFAKHQAGKGARFTRLDPPVHMIAAKKLNNRSEATKEEMRIKKLRAVQKRELALSWPILEGLPVANQESAS